MEKKKTITMASAITRMKNLKLIPGATFSILHLTCNLKTKECGQVVKHEHCRIRPALREDTFQTSGNLYLTYEVMGTGEKKMCFKRLIREVAFPPNYEFLKVIQFDYE